LTRAFLLCFVVYLMVDSCRGLHIRLRWRGPRPAPRATARCHCHHRAAARGGYVGVTRVWEQTLSAADRYDIVGLARSGCGLLQWHGSPHSQWASELHCKGMSGNSKPQSGRASTASQSIGALAGYSVPFVLPDCPYPHHMPP
jgi:hypothetical protein